MPTKTTEKPDRAMSRTIHYSYWNGEAWFAVMLTRESTNANLSSLHYAVCFLPKIASALSRLDREACNRELTPREEKNRARLDADAQAIAASIGATAVRQRDPRGLPLYLNFPGMIPDGFDPTSHYGRMLPVPVK